jgi:tRNA(Arg) A34 adenosine deaminase TadA
MSVAFDEARAAAARGEVPVGAAIARDGAILATPIRPRMRKSWRSARRRRAAGRRGSPTVTSM